MRNWAIANVTPHTIVAGSVWRTPRTPSMMNTSANGTKRPSSGVWRPTIAPSSCSGRPDTVASVVIGTARAPKATGAVLATNATVAALIGLNPRAISMTLVIATGVPKPARASSSAPNENATMTPWIRWSALILLKDRRSTSKWPVTTVML